MIRRFTDLPSLARAMADELPLLVERDLAQASTCHLVLSGGNTPRALFAELASRGRNFLPWDRIDLWWGDERCVPPDHAESNFGMAKVALIEPLGLTRYHRIEGERQPAAGAQAYEDLIYRLLGAQPAFGVIFLGIGEDGHTASLFPGKPIDPARIVIASAAPSGQPRISMTPKLINSARHVRFLVSGAAKADILAGIVKATATVPARLIHSTDQAWLVDEAAGRSV